MCSGSFPPIVNTLNIDGVTVVQHIDTDDAPAGCGDRTEWAGCHSKVDGVSHVWHSSLVSKEVVDHELSHAAGMVHAPWQKDFLGRPYAKIINGVGKYKTGQVLLITPRGEHLYNE